MHKKDIVYYDQKNFNGVLVVLREPHTDQSDEKAFEGNRDWFSKIAKGKELNQKEKMYYNRFSEMLEISNVKDLTKIAFTNIKLSGGPAVASKEYWKIKDKDRILAEIVDVVKPKKVFVLKEVFDLIIKGNEKYEQEGIKYINEKKPKRKVEVDGVEYYEIYHPAYRRKIEI